MQTGQRPRFHPVGPARLAVLALALPLASCFIALPGAQAGILAPMVAPAMANGAANGGIAGAFESAGRPCDSVRTSAAQSLHLQCSDLSHESHAKLHEKTSYPFALLKKGGSRHL